MKATAKYMFDEDFSGGAKPTITLVEHERRRADAESQAYRKGFAAGQEQAQTEAVEHIATALGLIADSMDKLHRALAGIEARLETEAVDVAVAVAGKLAPELIARQPFAEISALATDCFQHLVKTPHVVVHIARAASRAG
jgi:flagellar assembly protein FliH